MAVKIKSHIFDNQRGLSLIEVIIAGVILAFVLLSFGYMFAIGKSLIGGEGDRRLAVQFAQAALEGAAANASTTSGFAALEAQEGLTPTLVSLGGNHQYQMSVDYVNNNNYSDTTVANSDSLRITVTVSDSSSRQVEFRSVTLSTVVTRP